MCTPGREWGLLDRLVSDDTDAIDFTFDAQIDLAFGCSEDISSASQRVLSSRRRISLLIVIVIGTATMAPMGPNITLQKIMEIKTVAIERSSSLPTNLGFSA